MRAIGWVLISCVFALAACRSTPPTHDLSTWDGRFDCQIELVDDVGLPSFKIIDSELTLRDHTGKSVFTRWQGDNLRYKGKLQQEPDASILTADVRLWLRCSEYEIKFHRRMNVTNPTLIDGELQLTIDVRASDLPDDYLLVRGRAVVGDGTPVANHPLRLSPPVRLNDVAEYPAQTDADGRFIRLIRCREEGERYFERGELRQPDEVGAFRKPWNIVLGFGGEETEFDWFELQPVKQSPWHADFGEFTIGGALVEVEGSFHATLHFRSGSVHRSFTRSGEQQVMPPGRYAVFASRQYRVNEEYFDYLDVIDLKPGEHLVYRPEAQRPEMVEVKVVAPAGFEGRVELDAGSEGGGTVSNTRVPGSPALVPRFGLSGMVVQAEAGGFEDAFASLPPGQDRATISIDTPRPPRQRATPRDPWVVRASVEWPEGMTGRGLQLFAVRFDGLTAASSGDEGLQLFDDGEWKVYLLGGGHWGYPGGVMDGPVVVNTADPDSLAIVFKPGPPPILNPRWIGGTECTCGGNRVALQDIDASIPVGVIKYSSDFFESGFRRSFFGFGFGPGTGFVPTALFDGLAMHPFEIVEENDGHRTAIDLPPRVRLNVTGAQHHLEVRLESVDSTASCHTTVKDGEVSLWLPPGKAVLTIGQIPLFTREIDVSPGNETVIDWTANYGEVLSIQKLGDGLHPFYLEHNPEWTIYQITDAGEVAMEDTSFFYLRDWWWRDHRLQQLLPAGQYVARTNSTAIYGEKRFEVRAGERIQIELVADVVRPSCRVRLTAPKLLPGVTHGSFACTGSDELDWRFVDGGIEVGAVPVDSDTMICGWFSNAGRAWYLEPISIPQGYAGSVIDAQWRETRWGEADWFAAHQRFEVRLHGDAPWLRMSNFWIPVGEFELRVYDPDNEFVQPVTIDPSLTKAPMPEDVRKILRPRRR